MALKKYKGTGVIVEDDFKPVKWVGKTKSNSPVTIELFRAINLGNIDMTFAEKDDVVPEITYTATYTNTDSTAASYVEPWDISIDDSLAGADTILLGTGIFYIDGVAVGLTRGGGKFTVEREYREINADGDRGPVQGRIMLEGSRATLTMNALTFLGKFADLYPAITVETPTSEE